MTKTFIDQLTDQEWERTSQSWKSLAPKRNVNDFEEDIDEYYGRIKLKHDIPIELLQQWVYELYYTEETTNNYGWIDYNSIKVDLIPYDIDAIRQFNITNEFQQYVHNQHSKVFNDTLPIPQKELEYWEEHDTWRVAPIILEVESFGKIPDYADVKGTFQLIEGHTRLSILMGRYESGRVLKRTHYLYTIKKV